MLVYFTLFIGYCMLNLYETNLAHYLKLHLIVAHWYSDTSVWYGMFLMHLLLAQFLVVLVVQIVLWYDIQRRDEFTCISLSMEPA